jgi:hypothetical protein
MLKVNQSAIDGSEKRELPQEFDDNLRYGILRVSCSDKLGISTFINLPAARNLRLYFKGSSILVNKTIYLHFQILN